MTALTFPTQEQVDAHNTTAVIQREAATMALRECHTQEHAEAKAATLFPLAVLSHPWLVARSGTKYHYAAHTLHREDGTRYSGFSIPPTDRAVVSAVLCGPETWKKAMTHVNARADYKLLTIAEWNDAVIARVQALLDGAR